MTDIELLERAARAAGIDVNRGSPTHEREMLFCNRAEWSPLMEDADAFRLMVALELNVFHAGGNAYAMPSDFELDNEQCVSYRDAGGSESATRRAIVRAAAEMGENK